jgi:hypothetical protein
MNFKFDDSLRIRIRGGVESNQEIKVKLRVPAPLVFGHRNFAGGVSERRRMQVTGAGMIQIEMEVIEDAGRTGSSPRSC